MFAFGLHGGTILASAIQTFILHPGQALSSLVKSTCCVNIPKMINTFIKPIMQFNNLTIGTVGSLKISCFISLLI